MFGHLCLQLLHVLENPGFGTTNNLGYISKQETITINKTSEKSKLPDIGKLYKIIKTERSLLHCQHKFFAKTLRMMSFVKYFGNKCVWDIAPWWTCNMILSKRERHYSIGNSCSLFKGLVGIERSLSLALLWKQIHAQSSPRSHGSCDLISMTE